MNEDRVKIVALGIPQTKGSYRAIGQLTKTGKVKAWLIASDSNDQQRRLKAWTATVEAATVEAIKRTGVSWPNTDVAVSVDIVFRLPRPKSVRRPWPSKKGADLDKLVRAVFDALTNAGLWADDSQAVRLRTLKRYVPDGTATGAVIRAHKMSSILDANQTQQPKGN